APDIDASATKPPGLDNGHLGTVFGSTLRSRKPTAAGTNHHEIERVGHIVQIPLSGTPHSYMRRASISLYGDANQPYPSPVRGIRARMGHPTGENCMDNPLLGQEPLPPFAHIRPEHVEPGVRELLTKSRARIDQLAAVERPTFATVVEPLEELQ